MSDTSTTRRWTRRQWATLAVVLVLSVALYAVVRVQDQRMQEKDRLRYERSAGLSAPTPLSHDGAPLATHGQEPIVFETDITCPYCQEFFDKNKQALQELVDSEEFSVQLSVLNVRADSALNQSALSVYLDQVAAGAPPLAVYLGLSSAARDLSDDVSHETFLKAAAERVPLSSQGQIRPLSRDQSEWLWARTYENRRDKGVVPAVRYGNKYVTVDELQELTEVDFVE